MRHSSLRQRPGERRSDGQAQGLVDAIGQHVDKTLGKIADHAAYDVAFLAEDDRGGNAGDLQQRGKAVLEVDLLRPIHRFEERFHERMVFVRVDGQKDDVPVILEPCFGLFVQAVLRPARRAPSGPEIENNHFAEQRG